MGRVFPTRDGGTQIPSFTISYTNDYDDTPVDEIIVHSARRINVFRERLEKSFQDPDDEGPVVFPIAENSVRILRPGDTVKMMLIPNLEVELQVWVNKGPYINVLSDHLPFVIHSNDLDGRSVHIIRTGFETHDFTLQIL